jgi:hypothetical protein
MVIQRVLEASKAGTKTFTKTAKEVESSVTFCVHRSNERIPATHESPNVTDFLACTPFQPQYSVLRNPYNGRDIPITEYHSTMVLQVLIDVVSGTLTYHPKQQYGVRRSN